MGKSGSDVPMFHANVALEDELSISGEAAAAAAAAEGSQKDEGGAARRNSDLIDYGAETDGYQSNVSRLYSNVSLDIRSMNVIMALWLTCWRVSIQYRSWWLCNVQGKEGV
ncbi:unnamed protein product [Jaminaea pallidilutea]